MLACGKDVDAQDKPGHDGEYDKKTRIETKITPSDDGYTSTFTPFQNATRSLISAAACFGSG